MKQSPKALTARRPRVVGAVAAMALLSVPAVGSAAALPDGRGLELVNPSYTQGQRPDPQGIAADGNRVLYTSSGGFAGTPSLEALGAAYVADRTPSGWVTTAISPPATIFPAYSVPAIDFSADLGTSLWGVRTQEQKDGPNYTNYVRDQDGTWAPATPGLPFATSTVFGTSERLDRVLLAARERIALADGTVDTRAPTQQSFYMVSREAGGQTSAEQVAYRQGATLFPTCGLRSGGTGATARGAVSLDGRTAFFGPVAAGLPSSPCRSAANQRVWAKVAGHDAIDVSASQCTVDCGVAAASVFEGAARDGKRVFFTTPQRLVNGDRDTADTTDLYEYDFDASGNKLIPVTASLDAAGAGVVRVVRVSDDGSRAYFVATGRPIAGANARGDEPQPGDRNLYVYHRAAGEANGSIDFVGALAPSDSAQWGVDSSRRAHAVPASGRHLVFSSYARLSDDKLPGDDHADIYSYDSETKALKRIWTTDPAHNGENRTSDAVLPTSFHGVGNDGGGALQRSANNASPASADAGRIVFNTEEALDGGDTNGLADPYLWSVDSGELTLLSDGKSIVPGNGVGITPSGRDVFFTTTSRLLPEHTSSGSALYTARVGGGFPSAAPPTPPCEGDLCQPPSPGPLPFLPPVSDKLRGSGNVVPADEKPKPSFAVSAVTAKQRQTLARTGRLKLRVRVSTGGKVSVVLSARVPRRRGGALVRTRVATASRTAKAAGIVTMNLRLSPTARRQIKLRKRLDVGLTARFSEVKRTSTVRLVLRRASKGSKA